MKGTTMTLALAVAAALVCLASAQNITECPDGFEDFGDGTAVGPCLYFVRSKATWSNHRSLCQALGADLAQVTGDLHQDVVDYINDQPADDLADEAFWIGGSDANKEGSWIWVMDDTAIPLGTPHWYPCNGQPNGGTTQNHLSLYSPDFYYHSLEQTKQIFAICQIFE
ncbi:perlucin-like protein [Eriocheir sinensis]|uniref:perlucin-like protein n=1 Tax=Eriocheir sinensis TaxID=95602 RepID=UPI0021C58B92|nr:perlucin-like protein [Eriocheir sinensis]